MSKKHSLVEEMESGRPVFVLATAGDCGFCVAFRKKWPEIKQHLQGLNLVDIVEIEFPTMKSNLVDLGYPKDLMRYIRWFPTMMIFSAAEWKQALAGKDVKLNGVIVNGSLNNKGLAEPRGQVVAFTKESLAQWVQTQVSRSSGSSRTAHKSLYSKVEKSRPSTDVVGGSMGGNSACGKLNIRPKNRF
jgi:hypothetical protein